MPEFCIAAYVMQTKEQQLILIGMTIRIIRMSEEFTLETFALEAGINISHLTQIESGVVNIGFNTLYSICTVLEINLSDLIKSGEEDYELYI